jgi:MtaA/CmuA family methyltransferase
MTRREILTAALKGQKTPRPAWVPFVGVHGGHLLGVEAEEFLKSGELIAQGLAKANELYQPDGLPVVFDLQLEAEVLGCSLVWGGEVPPSVVSHPLASDPSALDALPEFSTEKGRFPIIKDAMARTKAAIGDDVALYGLITGPFTLLSHLRGSEVFLDLMIAPEQVRAAMEFATQVAIQTIDFYLDNGCEVIAVVDPMTSQIGPDHFQEFIAEPLNEIFEHVRTKGGLSSLFVCGDATRNLEVMCATACDNISVDENICLESLRDLARQNGKSFGGNLKLTGVLLLGDEDASKLDAIRCIDAGEDTGFVLAPGCDLPYATPHENLEAVALMVHDEYARKIAKATLKDAPVDTFDDIEVPDFAHEPEVRVDVITLDSEACAPCQYMMAAARNGAEQATVPVSVLEHKIKSRDGIGYMSRLGVKNLPTICIDGEAQFISEIPDAKTLAKAIDARAAQQGKG